MSDSRPMGLDEPRRATDIPATQDDIKKMSGRMANCEAQVASMIKTLDKNTEITEQTKDILVAVQLGLRVLGYIGTATQWAAKLATAVVAIYAAWQLIRSGSGGAPKP